MRHHLRSVILLAAMMATVWPATAIGRAGPIKEGQPVTHMGTLESSDNFGGESTGWILVIGKGKKQAAIDVDMSAIPRQDSFDGAQITITGTMHRVKYVERGETWILKAKRVKRVQGDSA